MKRPGDTGLYSISPAPYGSLDNKPWCGPAAIAAATGLDAFKVETAILRLRTLTNTHRRQRGMGGRRVKSTASNEIIPVCWNLGFIARQCGGQHWLTFKQLAAKMQRGEIKGPVIVLVTGHFLTLSRWQYVDNNSRTPQPHAKYERQRRRVLSIWFIHPRKV